MPPKSTKTVSTSKKKESAQTNAPIQEAEMQATASTKKPRASKKAAVATATETKEEDRPVSNVGTGPEAVVAQTTQTQAQPLPPNLEEPEKKVSSIRLCPTCDYYLYTQVEGEEKVLNRVCRMCGYKETDTTGGLVMEMLVQQKAAQGYKILINEYTQKDPTLPHIRKNMKCPNPACDSNHGVDPDIIYLKYDNVNLLYIYICNIPGCGFRWESAKR
jgi:DNA-directed RNA polymerase subunit M/transcription elongation factor TFIIS